jgi:Peptidase family M48
MRRWLLLAVPAIALLFPSVALSQTVANAVCAVTPIAPKRDLPNMFTPAQEGDLGEVLALIVENNAYEMDDPTLAAYLQHLGDRLAKNLPPSDLKFRFYLSNAPVANAFSIAGGRVYVTRKLIGFVRSEDELVGVLAHELGHIVTHQTAIDYTRFFKTIGITEVGDRKDIEAKFHQLLESGQTFRVSEEERQLEADRVGLELTALAGYKTDALADFFDRLTNNKGKTGTWFTELFGTTTESSKRLREMQKTLRSFPAECVQHAPQAAAGFHDWQSKVVGYSGSGRSESVPGLVSKRPLEPPLQDDIHTLRFSYDGKYLLAQDDASIYVLTREPLAFKFRIEAPGAYPVRFTSDSRRISFYDPDLHVEVWDVDAGSRLDVFEVVSSNGCMQTALSPDGRTLACVDHRETLVLFDTATDERIFEKKEIRRANFALNEGVVSYQIIYEIRFLNMGFSLDSRYLVMAGENFALAIDVPARREMPVTNALKPYLEGAFSFVRADILVGNEKSGSKAAVATFPEGQILHQIDLGASAPFPVAKGD